MVLYGLRAYKTDEFNPHLTLLVVEDFTDCCSSIGAISSFIFGGLLMPLLLPLDLEVRPELRLDARLSDLVSIDSTCNESSLSDNNTSCFFLKYRINTSGRRQSKMPILSRNVDQKSIETAFFDCHLSPHWRQMAIKTLFLSIFDPCSSIVCLFDLILYVPSTIFQL